MTHWRKPEFDSEGDLPVLYLLVPLGLIALALLLAQCFGGIQ